MSKVMAFFKGYVFRLEPWVVLAFTLFLIIFEWRYFHTNYREAFELIYDETLDLGLAFTKMGLLGLLIFGQTVLFVGASILSRPRFRLIYFLLFSLIVLVEYGYQSANDNFMALYDFRTAVGSPENWGYALATYFNPLAFIPILIFGAMLLFLRRWQKFGPGLLVGVLVVIVGVNVAVYLYTESNALETKLRIYASGPTLSLLSFFRMTTSATIEQVSTYGVTRQELSFQSDAAPQNNIVFIVDESVRADHLSLNGYERSTTPYLEELAERGILYNWGVAAAGSTCSYRSVILLMTGVTQLPDTDYSIKKWPTIFQYAKAMNYKTYYYDAESRSPRFGITPNDFYYVDEWVNQNRLGNDYDSDLRLAAEVAQVLNNSVGNFVVIHKRGVHFPYNGNFPNAEATWTPLLHGNQIVSDDVVALVNSYDNSLQYNIDPFFKTLLANEEILATTTMLYTSDHGDTLGAEAYPHCGPTRIEAAVPLFMLARPGLQIDTGYLASHHNSFATLLDLMDFPKQERRYVYSPSLLTATAANAQRRYFFHGSLFGFDNYEWVAFD